MKGVCLSFSSDKNCCRDKCRRLILFPFTPSTTTQMTAEKGKRELNGEQWSLSWRYPSESGLNSLWAFRGHPDCPKSVCRGAGEFSIHPREEKNERTRRKTNPVIMIMKEGENKYEIVDSVIHRFKSLWELKMSMFSAWQTYRYLPT